MRKLPLTPQSLPIISLEQVEECQRIWILVKRLDTLRVNGLLCHFLKQLHSQFTLFKIRPYPDGNGHCATVDMAHEADLFTPFVLVLLIDAKGVNPHKNFLLLAAHCF
jgi:hypothetical protein